MKYEVRSSKYEVISVKDKVRTAARIALALLVLLPALASAGVYDSMWTRIWEGNWVPYSTYNSSSRVLYDSARGRVIVAGQGERSDQGQTDMLLLCYDLFGNVKWSWSGGYGYNTDRGYALAMAPNGTVFIGGLLDYGAGVNGQDIFVVKVDTGGSAAAVYISNRDDDEVVYDMVYSNGRLFLAGAAYDAASLQTAYYVACLDTTPPNTPPLWVRYYVMSPFPGPGRIPPSQRQAQDVEPEFLEWDYTDWDNCATSISLSPDGDIVTAGFGWYSAGARDDMDWWVMKHSPTGTQRWATRFSYPGTQEHDDDYAFDVAVGRDSAIYVVGEAFRESGAAYSNEFAIAKFRGTDGTRLVHNRLDASGGDDVGFGVCVDDSSQTGYHVYATGYLENGVGSDGENIATAKFTSATLAREWLGIYDGEAGDDHAYEVFYKAGRVYSTGVRGAGTTPGAQDRLVALAYSANNPPSGFIQDTLWSYIYHKSGTYMNRGAAICVGDTDRVFVAGEVETAVQIPPRTGLYLSRLLVAHPDVAVRRIVEPVDTINLDAVVDSPRVWIRNQGNLLPTFKAWLHIGDDYADSALVVTLKPGDSALVRFKSWTASPLGQSVVTCSVSIAPDTNVANNRLVDTVFVAQLDAACMSIVAPAGVVDSGPAVTPRAWVRNLGNVARTFNTRFAIGAYADTQPVTLAPLDSSLLSFDPWTPPGRGDFATLCSTMMAGDNNGANDRQTGTVTVRVRDVAVTEIMAPADTADSGVMVTPKVKVFNYGTEQQSFTAYFRMEYGTGIVDYLDSVVVDLPPGIEDTVTFAVSAPLGHLGLWTLYAYHGLADQHPENDTLTGNLFLRYKQGIWPRGWTEVASIPVGITSKAVKAGGSVTHDRDRLYATKGYKTPEFYEYDPATDDWYTRAQFPPGIEARPPYTGCDLAGDGNGTVYATKGNNTFGFWKYSAAESGWTQLANVLPGPNGTKVKGGTGLVHVYKADTAFVYLLKGYRNEFYRYNPLTNYWETKAFAPRGTNLKYNKGSWIAYDGGNHIYALKARYNEFWKYDIAADTWAGPLAPMPLVNMMGRRKKAKDGSAGDWYHLGYIHALKGGNTVEFYRYDVAGDTWAEMDPMPEYGSTGRRKRVNAGADLTYYNEAYWALKGNRTREFWRYGVPVMLAGEPLPARDGVAANPMAGSGWEFAIAPNPLTGSGVLRYSVPRAVDVTVKAYTADGRFVATLVPGRRINGSGSVGLNADKLAAGIYVVRLATGVAGVQQGFKLVVR